MNISPILNQAFAQIEKLEHKPEEKCGYSNELLFKEYLRRLTKLYVLSGRPERFGPSCYVHLVKEEIEDLNDQVNHLLRVKSFYEIAGRGGADFIFYFLYWEAQKNLLPFELPSEVIDLYVPLIRIFERGGYISREMKIYEICGANQGFTLKPDYSEDPYLTDFSDAHLDYIDATHRD